MLFFRSLAFRIFFITSSLALTFSSLILYIFDKDAVKKGFRLWGKVTAAGLKTICKINISIRGAENIPTGGALIACKHQSAMETAILFALLDKPSIILKKELTYLPFVGILVRAADLIVADRKNGAATVLAITKAAQEKYMQGHQILIFPEGTRTPVNATPRYKRGVFALYQNLKTACTPVALNTGLFWPCKKFLLHPGTAIFEFLPPIAPGNDDQENFLTDLTTHIESATARIVYEGVAEQAEMKRKKKRLTRSETTDF